MKQYNIYSNSSSTSLNYIQTYMEEL